MSGNFHFIQETDEGTTEEMINFSGLYKFGHQEIVWYATWDQIDGYGFFGLNWSFHIFPDQNGYHFHVKGVRNDRHCALYVASDTIQINELE